MQSNLKAVNKALKLDPHNTELISEKQKILASSISETKEKLKQLRSVQDQVKQQYKDGTIDQGQYLAFQQELISTENQLKDLKKQQKDFNKECREGKIGEKIFKGIGKACDVAGEKLQKLGASLKNIGGKLSTHVTAPITALGTASVAAWNAVDDGADAVIKATGATGEAAQELDGIYKQIAADFPAEFETIGQTLGEVNTRFGYTGEEAKACSEQFLKFAEITGTDALSAVQLVSRAMGDAGIPAEEYSSLLDQLAVAAQASGISVDTLSEQLAKYGAPMRALGFDTAESIAIFSQWEKCGVNTETAFSGMKKAISNWSKEGKDARVEFKKTMDDIAAAPDIASATTKAIEAFGAKAGPDLADAIQGGRFEFSEFLSLLEGSEGKVDETFGSLEDGGQEAKRTINSLKLAGAELGDTMQQMAVPVLKKVRDKIKELTDHFRGLSQEQKEHIVKIGLLVAAVGPALAILGTVVSGVGKVISAIGTLGKVLGVLAAHPIVLVIAAIAGLVAAFIAAYKNSEEFRDKVNAAIQKVKDIWQSCVDRVKEILSSLSDAWNTAKGKAGEFVSSLKDKWSGLRDKMAEIGESIQEKWASCMSAVREASDLALEAAKATVHEKLDNIRSAYNEAGGGIRGIAAGANEAVKGYFTAGLTFVDKLTGGKLTSIKNAFMTHLSAARNTVSSIMDSIRNAFSSKIGAARDAVYNAIQRIKGICDFDWHLPHLKLPHFSITGEFSLNPPSVPKLSVSWYRNGGILSGAQIFGAMGSKLLGGGEAGKEAVLPLSSFYQELRSILGSYISGSRAGMQVDVHIDHFENYSDRDLDEVVDYVDDRIQERYEREAVALT